MTKFKIDNPYYNTLEIYDGVRIRYDVNVSLDGFDIQIDKCFIHFDNGYKRVTKTIPPEQTFYPGDLKRLIDYFSTYILHPNIYKVPDNPAEVKIINIMKNTISIILGSGYEFSIHSGKDLNYTLTNLSFISRENRLHTERQWRFSKDQLIADSV